MAERKRTGQSSKSEAQKKQQQLEQVTREQEALSLLDDPAHPDQASPLRGWIYFAVIVALALTLNLVALLAISGGR